MTGLAAKIGAGAAVGALRTFFAKIPVWLRWTVLGLLIAAVGLVAHHHYAHKAIAAAEKRGSDAAYSNVAKQARELTDKANALNRSLADKIRSQTDEALADNARAADDYRLRGAGAARCAPVAGVPKAASGRVEAAAEPDASGPSLLADDRAAVPWGWLVDRSEEHDALLIENKAWREWYATFRKRWDDWNAEAAKARAAPSR